jgi:hypothetical protein
MKITSLLETFTTPSTDPVGLQSQQAPKFGRSDKFLEEENLDETTTSGSVAIVAQPMGGVQRRSKGSIFSGIKTSKKFPNSKAVKEGAYEDGVRDGMQGTPNRRASSIYGPESSQYDKGYSVGVQKGKQKQQDQVAQAQADSEPYEQMSNEELIQLRKEIQQRTTERQQIYSKLRGSSFGFDPKRHLPPNHNELKQQGEADNKAWHIINQVLWRRGVNIDKLGEGLAEVSDETLTSYLTKVDADSQKHKADPTKRDPKKANKSVSGFSRAFNKLDARKGLNEFAPNDDGGEDRDHEYEVYQCNPDDQFDWIGGPIYKTDDMGKAHNIAYNLHKKYPNKAFMIWQERSQGSRGGYGIKDEQGVAEGSSTDFAGRPVNQELVNRQEKYWNQVAKEKKDKEKAALKAAQSDYEKTTAGKAEKYWSQKGVAETKKLSTSEKLNRNLKRGGFDSDASLQRIKDIEAKYKKPKETEKKIDEAELSEEQLLAKQLKKQLEIFKRAKDKDLSNRPKDREVQQKVKEDGDASLPGAVSGVKIMSPEQFAGQEVDEATKLPSQNRELGSDEFQDYMKRIVGTPDIDRKTGQVKTDKKGNEKYISGKTKTDRYKMPYVHRSSAIEYYDEAGKRFKEEAIVSALKQRPAKLLKQNEKMKHSNGELEQFFNVGFAALTGIAVDESTGKLIIVNTCPGAGSCKVDCFAMKGGKIQFKAAWLSDGRILTYLLNDPDGFFNQLSNEISKEEKAGQKGGYTVTIRWHDAGDFFSPEYLDLALKMAQKHPNVKFYAYTKMAGAALAQKPNNFIINWSEGANTSQEKQVKANDPNLDTTKNSRIVPEKLFYDLLKKDAKGNLAKGPDGQWQVADADALGELKQRLAQAYKISPSSILSYDEYMAKRKSIPQGMKYNVIVAPGEGDISANDLGVLSTLLLRH